MIDSMSQHIVQHVVTGGVATYSNTVMINSFQADYYRCSVSLHSMPTNAYITSRRSYDTIVVTTGESV